MLPTIPLDYNLDFVMCEGGDRGSKKSQIADIMGCGFLIRPTLPALHQPGLLKDAYRGLPWGREIYIDGQLLLW